MMKNVEPGPNFTNDTTDYTLLSFADVLNTVIFGDQVLITRIWKTQFRVYSDIEKALIDKCENEYSTIPHSKLREMFYGHPKHNGSSPFCKGVQEHLKESVGNRKMSRQNGNPVDESSIGEVNGLISYLCSENRVSSRDENWAHSWEKRKLIADLPAHVELAQSVQKAKLFGASTEFKDWFKVSMLH
jgi:hypothetical protein